jgi:hypothetical protein
MKGRRRDHDEGNRGFFGKTRQLKGKNISFANNVSRFSENLNATII